MTKPDENSFKYQALAAGGWAIILVGAGAIAFGVLANAAAGSKAGFIVSGLIAVAAGIWIVRRADDNIFRALFNSVFFFLDL